MNIIQVSMENKFTSKNSPKILTSKNIKHFSFVMSNDFIEKKYRFDKNNKDDNKKFINKMIEFMGYSWEKMKNDHYAKDDKTDKKDNKQIKHIRLSDSMRVHGYEQNGVFVIIRFDPNHNFHD